MRSSMPGRAGCTSRWPSRTGTWRSRSASTAADSTGRPCGASASPAWPTGWRSWTGRCASTVARGGAPRCAPRSRSPRPGPAMADPLRIVIAEDNYLVREGTRSLLEDSGEVTVLAAVGTATELLDAVARLRPMAVLTDIRMPPGHHLEGIEAAHAIRSAHPEVGVVVLSQHVNEAYAMALFEHGTAGLAYLLKERLGDLDDLLRALREVVAGRSVI